MSRIIGLLALMLLATACPSDEPQPGPTQPVELFPIVIPPGEVCSDTIEVPEADDTSHVDSTAAFNHNTDPPTSGRHFSEWITPTGVYDDPLPDGHTVHNLEHGHVFVQYDAVPDDERDAIVAPVRADPHMTLAAPRPGMAWKIALTSWTRIKVCSSVPPDVTDVVRNFILANRDSGVAPESVP